jgi:hypothetical protein
MEETKTVENEEVGDGTCTECNGACQPLTSNTKPEASEWYCDKCHKSYNMSEEDYMRYRKR